MGPHCIVGIDGSDAAVDALRWAVRHRADDGSEHGSVVALSAWHVPLGLRLLMAKRSFDVDRLGLAAEAEHHLDEAIRSLGEEGAGVERHVVEGHPAASLLDRAASASMLVLGRRGTSDLRHLLLGSVSRHCATHATVPTVIVPPGFDRDTIDTVTVGFDGSDSSVAALRWTLDTFRRGADIRVVTAVDLAPWLDADVARERFDREIGNEERRIRALLETVDHDGDARWEMVLHGARKALSDAADESDLVVLGTRGHGPLASAWLGSVSSWMLQWSPCPVAIVPN